MSPIFCFSPAHECPECSSGCCYAPDKIHLPRTTTLYQLKRSNICSHTPSSLTGTGYELKILKEHSIAGKLACEAAHFQPQKHRYNMLLFGYDVILLMGENDLFTMISLSFFLKTYRKEKFWWMTALIERLHTSLPAQLHTAWSDVQIFTLLLRFR